MTAPDERREPADPTARASDEPVVSTAPAAASADAAAPDGTTAAPRHRWWSAVPKHLGRARTSTVVLAVLFVSVFALYLNVKPEARERASGDAEVVETTEPTGTTEPTQTEPGEPTEPTDEPAPTTQPDPATGPDAPATTGPSTPDGGTGPTTGPGTTAPAPTGGSGDETVPDDPTE